MLLNSHSTRTVEIDPKKAADQAADAPANAESAAYASWRLKRQRSQNVIHQYSEGHRRQTALHASPVP